MLLLARKHTAVFITLITLLTVISYNSLPVNHGFAPRGNPPSSQTPSIRCFIYDRPPRTASTTIGTALQSCLRRHHFRQPPREKQRSAIPYTIFDNLQTPRKALLSRHFYLNSRTVSLLRKRCSTLFYITSCAPIEERLLSASKYTLSGGHGNSTLDDQQMHAAAEKANSSTRQKRFLNHYPYVDDDKKPINVSTPLVPNYVIRKPHLRQDLTKLLQTLQCDTSFVSGNVHRAPADESQILQHITAGDDTLYQTLARRALSHNALGLQQLKQFIFT
ncbi:hypothetical protein BWQ96_01924 [Gracilariopsis chorda]|uniref:Uncharacterized protein n=1 Tax=Gracilariopsis chorda TaxID=448386 RepID=A0A2V3J1M7_9FLOR|nr:hypothetical protein BWQ96_01924 [Gracilariopsis chorda]|eukprot:PXF48235.1 hypothetical protein BWQ96_01924 [Gracilariopsis chorda]